MMNRLYTGLSNTKRIFISSIQDIPHPNHRLRGSTSYFLTTEDSW